MEYNRVSTTPEVWAVIRASHPDLTVHSTYSNPDGSCEMGRGYPEMLTEYGFDGAPYPLIGARTTWEKGEKDWERINERHQYWFCVAIPE